MSWQPHRSSHEEEQAERGGQAAEGGGSQRNAQEPRCRALRDAPSRGSGRLRALLLPRLRNYGSGKANASLSDGRGTSSLSPEPSLQPETKPLCPTGLSSEQPPHNPAEGPGWLKPCRQGAVTREEARRERKGARGWPCGKHCLCRRGRRDRLIPSKALQLLFQLRRPEAALRLPGANIAPPQLSAGSQRPCRARRVCSQHRSRTLQGPPPPQRCKSSSLAYP